MNPDGPAQGTLRPGDKILEVDGIDFTKSDHNNAVAVLRATGAVVSMMISRHQWHPVRKRNDIFFLFSVTSDQFIHIELNTLHVSFFSVYISLTNIGIYQYTYKHTKEMEVPFCFSWTLVFMVVDHIPFDTVKQLNDWNSVTKGGSNGIYLRKIFLASSGHDLWTKLFKNRNNNDFEEEFYS